MATVVQFFILHFLIYTARWPRCATETCSYYWIFYTKICVPTDYVVINVLLWSLITFNDT